MNKLYTLITWNNGTTPAINEDNLNAMSTAIDDIDDRVIELGGDVLEIVPEIQEYLDNAEALVEALETLSQNPPYIGANGDWYVWDTNTSAFVDSGIDASITVDIADITMLSPDANPYVTNTGTNTDPVFHLFIPRGQTGASGNGIASIAKTSTSGNVDTYTITYTNGDTDTFTVTNGTGSTLSGLSDVNISTPSDGQVLKYDNATSKWVNGTGGGGSSSLSGLSDVSITSALDGQFLVYDNASSKWKNASKTIPQIDDSSTSASSLWSSNKVNTELGNKANTSALPKWSSAVACAVGATSCTITDASIATTSVVEPFSDSSTPIPYTSITVTTGQAVIAFDALEAATNFKVRISN